MIYPDLAFAMANLIQDGTFRLGDSYDRSGVNHDKPIFGIVKSLSFNPSLDDGSYEFNNKIIAKHYKLSIKIDLLLRSTYGIFINGFDDAGHYTEDASTQLKEDEENSVSNLNNAITTFGIIAGNERFRNLGDYAGKYYSLESINRFSAYSDSKYAANKDLFLGYLNNKQKRK